MTDRYPLGSTVRLSAEGKKMFPQYQERTAKVVGHSREGHSKLLFVGNKMAVVWNHDYVELLVPTVPVPGIE